MPPSVSPPHRIVLVGSSLFTARCLNQLLALPSLTVVGVITNPQQFSISYAPTGVDNIRHANMGELANNHGIPAYVMQTSMHEPALAAALNEWQPHVILVAGWYHMVPQSVRALAPCLGLHASLLPKYSGGAPLVWSLIENATETGMTLFLMDSGVDSGPIVGQKTTAITPHDTIETLNNRVEALGLELIADCVPLFLAKELTPLPQHETDRTLYPQRNPSDGWLDITLLNAEDVYHRVRAQTAPYPGAFARINNQWAHLWAVSVIPSSESHQHAPLAAGEAKYLPNGECWAGCQNGAIRLDKVTWLETPPYPQPTPTAIDTQWRGVLQAIYDAQDEVLQTNFQRSLPFQDALFDRWERAKRLGFGEGTSIYNSAIVMGTVTVGKQTWIGPNTLLDGTGGGLSIGNHCSISAGVHVYTHNTVQRCLSMGQAAIDQAPVSIGDGVYIGAQSIVRDGVSIGNRVVIGANCFVNKSIPDNTIVAGIPAKVIGQVIIHPDGSAECCYAKAPTA